MVQEKTGIQQSTEHISYPRCTSMDRDTQIRMINEFMSAYFPYRFSGNVQSCYFYKNESGKKVCMANNLGYDELIGNKSFHYRKGYENPRIFYPAGAFAGIIADSRAGEYVTVNIKKAGTYRRQAQDFEFCCGIPIDLDCHASNITEEEREIFVSNTMEKLMGGIKSGRLPEPTIILLTGRGIQFHYRFPEPVLVSERYFIHSIWRIVSQKLMEFVGDEIEIDKTVGDLSRVMRVPGTYNPKSKSFAYTVSISGKYYSPEELCSLFGIDVGFAREEGEKEKAAKEKRGRGRSGRRKDNSTQGARQSGKAKKRKDPRNYEDDAIREILISEDLRGSCLGVDRDIKRRYLKMMSRLIDLRKDWTGYREVYLHIFFNIAIYFNSRRETERLCIDMWHRLCSKSDLSDPVGMDEVQHILDTFWCKIYDYRNLDTFVDKLAITPKELAALGMGKKYAVAEQAAQAKENNKLRNAKRTLICHFRVQGMKLKAISDAVNKELDLFGTAWECNYEYVKWIVRKEGVTIGDSRFLNAHIESAYRHDRRMSKTGKDFAYQKMGEKESAPVDKVSPTETPLPKKIHSKDTVDDAFEAYRHGDSLIILGEGGTGKSQLIQRISDDCIASGKSCVVSAPTNLASKRIGGSTIYKLFRIDWVDHKVYAIDDEEPIKFSRKLLRAKVIIIDECALIRADIMLRILKTIKKAEAQSGIRKQLICLGDFGQLKPVCTAEEWEVLKLMGYTSKWVFDLGDWESTFDRKIVLTKCFRIVDETFKRVLDKVRIGNISGEVITYLNALDHQVDLDAVYIAGLRKTVWLINTMRINDLFKDAEKRRYNTSGGEYDFAVGMKARITQNRGRLYKNGYCGVIKAMKDRSVVIKLRPEDGGHTVEVYCSKHGVLPVVPGYAITVHQAQGQTFESINIIPEIFEGGQLYTMLSRVRTSKGIHLLKKIKPSDIRVNREALAYQYGIAV